MEEQKYFYGTGRRKEAVARVRLVSGNGAIIVNNMPYEDHFPCLAQRQIIQKPLLVTDSVGKYNVIIKVEGGGVIGQAGAIAHGISRALLQSDERLRKTLREDGLLTRDSRVKERKKVGLRRARKAPQYTKR